MGRPLSKPKQPLKALPDYVTLKDPEHAAQFLQAVRVLEAWSQTEVAETLGIMQSGISEWETGLNEPMLGNFMAWAHTLGYHVELYKFDDPEDDDAAA